MYKPEQKQQQDKQEVYRKRQERKAESKEKKEVAKRKIASMRQVQHTPSNDEGLLTNVAGKDKTPLSAIFLGPHAENFEIMEKFINEVMTDYVYWRRNYFPTDPLMMGQDNIRTNSKWYDYLDTQLRSALNNLKAHFPFYSPRYMAHMLCEQTLPSLIGYFAGMLYNPNNVTDEAAPVTVDIEIEFGNMICEMLGYKKENSWAHICSGGTLANLEALWVARETQFTPLVIKEFCQKNRIADGFQIKRPNGVKSPIVEISEKDLLQLRPNEALFITKSLIKFLKEKCHYTTEAALEVINSFIPKSVYSIKHQGIHNVLARLNLKPVVFVPESAHYSFKKAVNILGYGEDAIRPIPVAGNFRISVDSLRDMILSLGSDEYIAAVVCVVGTTEEGAVDPVHRVKFLRDDLEQKNNQSFWFHVDSAWGGYIRTLFVDDNYKHINIKSELSAGSTLDQIVQAYIKIMDASEVFKNAYGAVRSLSWHNTEVLKAFLAMPDADSITVDPHKLGYVPYPAGVIAFKNKNVTQLVAQKAQYISNISGQIEAIDTPRIDSVGSYIIEGSKPGAAAMSCWLSAKTIPLNLHNHGKVIKTTLLNAQRFAYYIRQHHKMTFISAEKKWKYETLPNNPFKFVTLYDNIDTNVVCFLVVPMRWDENELYDSQKKRNTKVSYWGRTPPMKDAGSGLSHLNELNKAVYQSFTIQNMPHEQKIPPYGQQFFVSKTILDKSQYAYSSIEKVLDKLDIKRESYENEGLFVLRSTIMNPWYYTMYRGTGGEPIDYFMLFIEELHKVARAYLNQN